MDMSLLAFVAALLIAGVSSVSSNDVVVIGAGFSGLTAACDLSLRGWNVTVVERLEHVGGRAQRVEAAPFTWDAGPSFYWMPEVIDRHVPPPNIQPP